LLFYSILRKITKHVNNPFIEIDSKYKVRHIFDILSVSITRKIFHNGRRATFGVCYCSTPRQGHFVIIIRPAKLEARAAALCRHIIFRDAVTTSGGARSFSANNY